MTDAVPDRVVDLRHQLSNPLSALIAEVQLTLMSAQQYDGETRQSLRDIEVLALRMHAIMHDSRRADVRPAGQSVEETS